MAEGLQSLPDGASAAIKSILQKSAIKNVNASVEDAVPKGQNFSGVVHRVTVTGEKDGQRVNASYIVKVASDNESIRADIALSILYQREAIYYTELFPIYQRMQNEAGVPSKDQIRFAECYNAGIEYFKEYLVFEDLKPRGFVTLDRQEEMDYEHARCALEAYGKLHALSFALKMKEPKTFAYFTQNIPEVTIIKGSKLTTAFKLGCEKAIPVVKNVKHKKMLEDVKDTIIDRVLYILTQDEFSVLSHSDCWSANMMFNHKNGKPTETCLIDFQVCRYGAPTLDVMYYIFGNTGHKLREECYEDLLSLYHNAMKNHLKALSCDIDQIYPWARFKQDLKSSSIFGLAMGLVVAMVILSEEIPDPTDITDAEKSTLFNSKISDIYKERVNGIVEDIIKYGYLS